jgi:RimJ/RimL family protein N-acetyltransferase
MEFKLRPWTINDLDSVTKSSDNINITRFMSDRFPDSRDKWKTLIENTANDVSKHYLAIEIEGQAVGGIGVTLQQDIMRNNAELGYWLSEDYWGLGIMTKAIKKIVNLAFEKFDINRIFATPFETNIASQRILEKCGFIIEARFDKIVIKDGELLDEFVYGIRRKDNTL